MLDDVPDTPRHLFEPIAHFWSLRGRFPVDQPLPFSEAVSYIEFHGLGSAAIRYLELFRAMDAEVGDWVNESRRMQIERAKKLAEAKSHQSRPVGRR